MRSVVFFVFACLLLAGCPERNTGVDPMPGADPPGGDPPGGDPPGGDPPGGDPPGISERFVGEWMIDQPFHAGYEASWYDFEGDGTLVHSRDCAVGGRLVTGWVMSADFTRRCDFGDRWSSLDDATLVIAATCTDGSTAEIVLGFSADASTNSEGLTTVDVISVGDETDWGHAFPEWRWVKCVEGSDACTPLLTEADCR